MKTHVESSPRAQIVTDMEKSEEKMEARMEVVEDSNASMQDRILAAVRPPGKQCLR